MLTFLALYVIVGLITSLFVMRLINEHTWSVVVTTVYLWPLFYILSLVAILMELKDWYKQRKHKEFII